MKTLIIALLFGLLMAFTASAQPVFTNLPITDFQSVNCQFSMDFTGTGYGFPFSVQMYYREPGQTWVGFSATTVLSNQWGTTIPICTQADSVSIFWKTTNVQSGDTFFSDTISVSMPLVANENPWNGILASQTVYLNSICAGSRGITSITKNVGDTVRLKSLIFREYNTPTSKIDSIIVWLGNVRLAKTDFIGPASSPNTWLHVMEVDSNLIIGTGDTVRTEIQVNASASQWQQGMEVDQSIELIAAEINDWGAYYNFCASTFPIQYGCGGGSGSSATVTITSPDTLVLGDSVCVVVESDQPITLYNNNQSWAIDSGTTTICIATPPCANDQYYWWSWEDNQGWVNDTMFMIWFVRPYTLAITTVGATNATISVTTSTSPLMLFLHENNTFGAVDSTTMVASGVWSLTGLIPSSSYYILGYFIGVGGDTISDCFAAGGFTTAPCGDAEIVRMIVINNGTDIEITLQFPAFSIGSIVWVNNVPITLVQTGTSTQGSLMVLTIPYTTNVTVQSPCGNLDNYPTATTSIANPTFVKGLSVTPESISTGDQELLINLYDLTGKVVATGKGNVITTGVSPGVYVYIIMNPKGEVVKKDKYVKL